jgi:glycolate oxidase FAD binding subunit
MLSAALRLQTITLGGRFSKNRMAGPIEPSDVTITTTDLRRVLKYEPRDLTISVEAGLPFSELTRLLAENRQMVPLDPPYSEVATVGGVIAANMNGPRRRLYGTARDLVIGMIFVTLEGKLVQSGGMVVKNVAGLDMGKLMIGSFGTLAAIAVVNFKLLPIPPVESTFVLSYESLPGAISARDALLKSVLQPTAIDLLNPKASVALGLNGYSLVLQAGGNRAVIERYERELRSLGQTVAHPPGLPRTMQEFTPQFLATHAAAAVVRISCTLSQIKDVLELVNVPAIARAGSGVCYLYFDSIKCASAWMGRKQWKAIIEFAPEDQKYNFELWPDPGTDFEIMKKVKHMFDPNNLLNRGRLYRHL